jgi:predicted dehydrogenase
MLVRCRAMRFVVIGVGHWHARRYVAGFRKAGGALAGVYDAEPGVAAALGRELEAPSFDSAEELIERRRPDLALLMGEPRYAILDARMLAERRIPFVAEKPISTDSRDVFALAEAVEAAGLFAAVAFPNRALRLWGAWAELSASGEAGRLSHLAYRAINGPPQRYADWGCAWMLDPARAGGGALHNLGIHGVDGFLHLTGADPDQVTIDGVTLTSHAHGLPIEDYGVALVRAPDGTTGMLEAGYVYPVLASGMTRGGDGGWRLAAERIYLEEAGSTLRITRPDGSEETRPSDGGYEAFCLDTTARFARGEPPVATVRDCARAVRLLERIYAAAGVGVTRESPSNPSNPSSVRGTI